MNLIETKRKQAKQIYQSFIDQKHLKLGLGIIIPSTINKFKDSSLKITDDVNILELSKTDKNYIKEIYLSLGRPDNKIISYHRANVNNLKVILIEKNLKKPIYIKGSNSSVFIITKDNTSGTIIDLRKNNEELLLKISKNCNFTLICNNKGNSNKIIEVNKDSKLKILDCYFSSNNSKIITKLIGENAICEVNILFFGNNNQIMNIESSCKHLASNTKSNMIIKGAVKDASKIIFNGIIKINKNAKNCHGFQKEDSLILNDKSRCVLIPNLEIANNNVICSHSATISKINEEQLFYLSTRGINKDLSKKMIINGFFKSILNKFTQDIIKNIEGIINEK